MKNFIVWWVLSKIIPITCPQVPDEFGIPTRFDTCHITTYDTMPPMIFSNKGQATAFYNRGNGRKKGRNQVRLGEVAIVDIRLDSVSTAPPIAVPGKKNIIAH